MDGILADLQRLANARAKNGALQSRLGYAYDNASISKSNMEAARSRIIDVDIAEESTKFASYNILTQASIYSRAGESDWQDGTATLNGIIYPHSKKIESQWESGSK